MENNQQPTEVKSKEVAPEEISAVLSNCIDQKDLITFLIEIVLVCTAHNIPSYLSSINCSKYLMNRTLIIITSAG